MCSIKRKNNSTLQISKILKHTVTNTVLVRKNADQIMKHNLKLMIVITVKKQSNCAIVTLS